MPVEVAKIASLPVEVAATASLPVQLAATAILPVQLANTFWENAMGNICKLIGLVAKRNNISGKKGSLVLPFANPYGS